MYCTKKYLVACVMLALCSSSEAKSHQNNTADPIIGTWNLNFTATPLEKSEGSTEKGPEAADQNEKAVVFEGGFTFHKNGTIMVTSVPKEADDTACSILPPLSYGNWQNVGENLYKVVLTSAQTEQNIRGEAIAYFELSKDCKAIQFAGVSSVSA